MSVTSLFSIVFPLPKMSIPRHARLYTRCVGTYLVCTDGSCPPCPQFPPVINPQSKVTFDLHPKWVPLSVNSIPFYLVVAPPCRAGRTLLTVGVANRPPWDTNHFPMMLSKVFARAKRMVRYRLRSGGPSWSVSPTSANHQTNGRRWKDHTKMSHTSESSSSVRIHFYLASAA